MPNGGRKHPEAAYAEDCDSHDEVKPQSRVNARIDRSDISAVTKLANLKISDRPKKRETAPASDSGYSSVHSGPAALTMESPSITTRPAARSVPSDSATSKITAVNRSSPAKDKIKSTRSQPRAVSACSDPECSDPECNSNNTRRNKERRRTVASDTTVRPPPINTASIPQPSRYSTPVQAPPQTFLQPQLTPSDSYSRRASFSGRQQRPASYHAPYSTGPVYGQHPPYVATPTPSPYLSIPSYNQPTSNPLVPGYAQAYVPSPITPNGVQPSPTAGYGAPRVIDEDYSTRRSLASYSTRSTSVAPPPSRVPAPAPVRRASSTRRRHVYRPRERGSFSDGSDYSSYDSDSVSSTSSREERRRRRRREKRDSIMMPPPSRRPAMPERFTEPLTQASHISRSALRRSRDMHSGWQYDPPARPASDHHDEPSYSYRPREPFYRDEFFVRNVPRGHPDFYSPRGHEDLAEDYIRRTNGVEGEELTAERIHQQANVAYPHGPKTHMSRKSSVRSGRSKSDGITIQAGETLVQLYGAGTLEFHEGKDGESHKVTIGTSNSRETQGGSVHSYGSRSGFRRERHDARPVHEGGYECAL